MRLLSYLTPGFPTSLFERFGAVLDADVTFETELSGPAPGVDPFRDGTVDLGWICSTSYVDLATRGEAPTVQLAGVAWVPDDPDADGRPVYFGDIITRADSPIGSFDDLRGRRIGCNDPVSLSGHYALRFAAGDRGRDPATFFETVFTGGHHRSIDLVLSGRLDAAVVDSVVRTGRARLDERVASLRIIERLGPWPVQPLVARADLGDDVVADVQHRLLEAAREPAVAAELEAASLDRLVAVGPDHYAPVRAAMDRL